MPQKSKQAPCHPDRKHYAKGFCYPCYFVNIDQERRVGYSLQQKYGISFEQYEELLKKQKGLCKICKRPSESFDNRTKMTRRLTVDHNHLTNAVRGLLCNNCNNGLGCFKDDKGLLQEAIKYLEETNEETTSRDYSLDVTESFDSQSDGWKEFDNRGPFNCS